MVEATADNLWLKTLEGALEDAQMIPLWGMPPAFPWERFSEELAKLFELPCHIKHHQTQWLKNPLDGLGENPSLQYVALTPLPGSMIWAMTHSTLKELTELLLTKDHKEKGFSDESFFQGFYQFTCLKVFENFNRHNLYGNLTLTFSKADEIPKEGAFCIDVSLELGERKIWGRLICPREMKAAFQTHFAMEKPPLLTDPSFKSLPLNLAVEIGSSKLTSKQWKKVKTGDFIVLDRCTFDPDHKKGTAMLTCSHVPLFDLRIKEAEIKILEYAFFKEENPMENPPEDEDFSDEEFSNLDFEQDSMSDEDELEETEESTPSIPEEEEEESLSLPEEEPMKEEEEAPLWSSKDEEKDTEALLKSEEIPLTLTVEITRLQMPLEKLTKLKPGNVLNLSISPQLGVHLTVSGKRVAKGELVKFGDVLGVKILKVGE